MLHQVGNRTVEKTSRLQSTTNAGASIRGLRRREFDGEDELAKTAPGEPDSSARSDRMALRPSIVIGRRL